MGGAGSHELHPALTAITNESECCFTRVMEFYSIKKLSNEFLTNSRHNPFIARFWRASAVQAHCSVAPHKRLFHLCAATTSKVAV